MLVNGKMITLLNKKDFLRIKFDDKDDDSISHTLKAFNFINKLLEKTDDFYRYEFKVLDIKGDTVVDIFLIPKVIIKS